MIIINQKIIFNRLNFKKMTGSLWKDSELSYILWEIMENGVIEVPVTS